MKTKNPFALVGYLGPDYFCDREQETRKLVSWLENGSNVTLMVPRRYGKTGHIHHVFHNLPDGFRGIYLDITNHIGRWPAHDTFRPDLV